MLCMHLVFLYFHQSEMITMHEIIALLYCLFLNIVYLNWSCRPYQSMLIVLRDLYHNLASPTNVRQNLWTLTPS